MPGGMIAALSVFGPFLLVAWWLWRADGGLRDMRNEARRNEAARAELDRKKREELAQCFEENARLRVEHRESLPARWADEAEKELEAGRRVRRLRWSA
jgi:hypothetical protein